MGGAPERPTSLVLVHGAASGPWIFEGWSHAFPGDDVVAVDLHDGRDVASASMSDYAQAVVDAARSLTRPLVVCGWSMGGLVALMAAEEVAPDALVLLEPSPPAEIAGYQDDLRPSPGLFEGEQTYGRFPAGIASRPESAFARAERKRGISVPHLTCPALVVYSDEFPDVRGRSVAALYRARELHLRGLDHWGLVLDRRVPPAIARALSGAPHTDWL